MFLLEVSDYQRVRSEDNEQFRRFTAIVKKFVEPGAIFEVNICSKTNASIMRLLKEAAFKNLGADEKVGAFNAAAKETSHLLSQNLLRKFYATAEYKAIVDQLSIILPGNDEEGEEIDGIEAGING